MNNDGTYDLKDRHGRIQRSVTRSEFTLKRVVRANSFVGTQGYISPQMAKNSGVSLKEDVWAFGIVLYEWATGRHPLGEEIDNAGEYFGRLWEVMSEHDGVVLPPATEAGGVDFSDKLRDIVVKCLRKRPSERPTFEKLKEHPFLKEAEVGACQRAFEKFLQGCEGTG